MTRTEHVNADFMKALQKSLGNPDILADIADTLGSDEYSELEDTDQFPVSGFFLDVGPELVKVFVVTPGRLCIYERNREGSTLSVVLPIERVKRVSVQRSDDASLATLELDADRMQVSFEGNFATEPRVVDGRVEPNQSFGRAVGAAFITPATYVIKTEAMPDPGKEEEFKAFVRAVRNSIGY